MAKKRIKKFLKKAAKAALIGGALYAGVKGLGKRGLKGNVSKTAATEGIKYTPGAQIPDAPFIKRRKKWDLGPDTGPDAFAAKGGRIGAKHGGHVKSMGVAKRGGGVAKR